MSMSETRKKLLVWRRMAAERFWLGEPLLVAAKYVECKDWKVSDLGQPSDQPLVMAINPKTLEILFNPTVTEKNSDETNAFVLAHEAAHFVLNHVERVNILMHREGSDFCVGAAIIAEEECTNELVMHITGWPMPKGQGIVGPESRKGMSLEQRYVEIKKEIKHVYKDGGKGGGHCQHKVENPGCHDGRNQGDKASSAVEMLREQIQDAAQHAAKNHPSTSDKQPGDMPGELRELLLKGAALACPPKWEELLAKYLTAMEANCKNFDPRTIYRRYLADGHKMVVPNLSSNPVCKRGGISIDNSGSVGDDLFETFLGTLQSIGDKLGFQEFMIYHFTSEVMKRERLTNIRQLRKVKREASGGTAIEDCNQHAQRDKVQFNIILTDGYVEWLNSYAVPTLVVIPKSVGDVGEPPKVKNLIGCIRIE